MWSSQGPQGQRRLQSHRGGLADLGKLAAGGADHVGHGRRQVHLLAHYARVHGGVPRLVVLPAHRAGLAVLPRRTGNPAAQRRGGLRRAVGEAEGGLGGEGVLEVGEPRGLARVEKAQLKSPPPRNGEGSCAGVEGLFLSLSVGGEMERKGGGSQDFFPLW